MRILNTNLLDTATLSAGGTSVNYPLANLKHVFLKKKFQQIIDYPDVTYSGTPITYTGEVVFDISDETSALTLTWDTDQTIDTVMLGYTNAKQIELRLYDSASALLYSSQFTDDELGAVFAAVAGVRSAKVLMAADGDAALMTVYLGGLGIGLSYVMPDPVNDWQHGLVDNSFGVQTLDGQVLGQYIEPLRSHVYNFMTNSFAIFNEVKAIVKAAGKYTPLWIAPFENSFATVKPLYATINGMESIAKNDNVYSFSLTFQEAR
jgi:hypothetical protein